ncbi:OB-fold nucleic acid binding domain-containing protein [Jeotgalibaca sp. MA1X17-3]|uniref:3'-5' exoribonuclease YhaM family protein n=1 Tax=Jeotgalibaca sp. MA1X17-3 TaxID=2908211 RepID=UPI001F405D04|nr:OB-fold nucleic acid binding domain-containing protein [Jeotgalibaca sp. MA1X17-3]UJF15192.1 OB-fold nucleic acid binding domain-containing protein [Jeotgalibaca sp. MA1X17-3]
MTKKIYEYELDEAFEIYLLIKSADVRLAKNNKPFIAFTFQDRSGQIDGKFWDAKEDEINRFQAGTVVKVSGKRELYQNNPQLRITKMRIAHENEAVAPEHFIERAPLRTEEMVEEINRVLFEITSAPINRIVRYILNKYQKAFFDFPAAKRHHHAFAGGLSYHTVSILRLAETIAKNYTGINHSLLYGGIILHDIGKTIELTGALSTEYTLKGNLIGHIVLVDEEITKACEALKIEEDTEDVILLKHVVLAHHGKLEFGSPVVPHLLEAEIIHHLDNLDASINMIDTAIQRTKPGEFSERVFGLGNRNFYKPSELVEPDSK